MYLNISNDEEYATIFNYFNFKKMKDNYLLTNDAGKHVFLTENEFQDLIAERIKPNTNLYTKLANEYFITKKNREVFIDDISDVIRKNKGYLFTGTQLHIFVLTNECNQSCIYCQASAKKKGYNNNGYMTIETAEKSVDIALQSPSKYMNFEFQGGEPLLNFDVLKHIVEYTKRKNRNKNIEYNLVTNLTCLTNEILDFLTENKVSICTSLDGNKYIHDINRPLRNKSSYELCRKNILKVDRYFKEKNMSNTNVQALLTITRHSLGFYKDIINEYVALGFNNISIRPLTPLGICRNNWEEVGYTPEEFVEFYQKSLEYIIELNSQGIFITESTATLFLKKILLNLPINHMEFRSPCGGGIGQIAYNFNGNIYTCDEGRMLAEMGDESFKIGSICESNYIDLIENTACKTTCISSCLDSIPFCTDCVYSPYCGTCPVYNYVEFKTIFSQMPRNYKCKINRGIFDIIFEKLREHNSVIMDIFLKWVN